MLAACSSPSSAPAPDDSGASAQLSSCGLDLTFDQVPTRAVTLEQGATEMMLALGLGDSMVGTSYLTDAVAPEFAGAYEQVPVLADQYPTAEQLRGADPDFVYSMRASAFAPDAVGERSELRDLEVPAYLSSNDCEDPSSVSAEGGFEQIFAEVTDIATIFDVADRGEDLIAEQEQVLDQVTSSAQDLDGVEVVWIYSTINGAPIVAGNAGLPQTMTELAGSENAFDDLDAQWTETTWDQISQRDPEVLVLADLSRGMDGDSAQDKIETLRADPVTSQLAAVREDRMVAIPATEMDPSVRSIDALSTLSDALVEFEGAR
ncbi:ABC transporter substrate-binding protein [Propioniferax innocua]|nr:ABC transporter substrate-binding protein [Propioniferax innocua]